MWNIEDSRQLMVFNGHTDRATSIVPHPMATISQSPSAVNLVSTGVDSLVNLWSLESSTPLVTLKGHTHRVNKAAFHPCGKYMGTCSTDLTWKLWDIETGREIYEQEGHSR
jgi:U4/U6 small nuclear ribonucleoprotein PRP4